MFQVFIYQLKYLVQSLNSRGRRLIGPLHAIRKQLLYIIVFMQ